MKFLFFAILCSFSIETYFAQTSDKETRNIAAFCKIWGFLKYYHPTVATGIIDWDKEFTDRFKIIADLSSKEAINNYYSDWINELGSPKICKKCRKEVPDSLRFNLDIAWIKDSSMLSSKVMDQLQFILDNRNQEKNYYVQTSSSGNTKFVNERVYKDSVFPSAGLRLLGLARYWNAINYFYPYKYKIGENWNDVLLEMIPRFLNPSDTISYHLAMRELVAKINDSHAGLVTHYTNEYFGYKWAPFQFKIIDDKVVVTGFYNDSLCRKDDIRIGDVFLKVNGATIAELVDQQSKYVSASNKSALLRDLYYAIFNGETDSLEVVYERNGTEFPKTIHRYYFDAFNYKWGKNDGQTWKILDDNIGYVDMDLLVNKQTAQCLKELRNTKAIIFDVRNYPKGTMYQIARFLDSEKKPFALFTEPDLNFPGVFQYTKPYYCGGKNKNAYKGKVVLLFNEQTQSHAEFTLMALETAPNVVKIGSQTAGADGNVSQIVFPGNYSTYFTGIGVYYPDGRETQRIGIVPDIEVNPTIEGIREGRDEVLEKAIEIINKP